MKKPGLTLRCRATLLAIAALLGAPQLASAVQMSVYVTNIRQWGTGSGFYLGHTVSAFTNYNSLSAGGTYIAQCISATTIPVTGERGFSGSTLAGPTRLTVTIPAQQPAIRNLSGWAQVPEDTELSCNYRWTAFATEGGYSISAGGISFPVGSGSVRDGGTVDFTMYRPSRGDADGGCIP